jgi:hypothetical protein
MASLVFRPTPGDPQDGTPPLPSRWRRGSGGRYGTTRTISLAQHPLPRRRPVDGRRRSPRPSPISERIWPPPVEGVPEGGQGELWCKMNYAALGPRPQQQCVAQAYPNLVYGSMRRKHWCPNQRRVSPSSVRWREVRTRLREVACRRVSVSHPRLGELDARLDCCHCCSSGRGQRRRTGRAASEDPVQWGGVYRTCTHLDLISIRERAHQGQAQRSVDEQCYVLPPGCVARMPFVCAARGKHLTTCLPGGQATLESVDHWPMATLSKDTRGKAAAGSRRQA